MSDSLEGRVAVYIDFDNIVISRYDQVHGRGGFKRDGARDYVVAGSDKTSDSAKRTAGARVDLGAILDYSSSFGTVAISRAYADWSVPVNANYKGQLVGRAVDLVQMFPTVQSMKNGADIRMSVDVVEDLFRLPEITHVVIVSGDSDFIALAQRCRRLGRYVVGIGVAGGTSKALNAACNEYKDYDGLPGLDSDLDSDDDSSTPAPKSSAVAAPDKASEDLAPAKAGTKAAKPVGAKTSTTTSTKVNTAASAATGSKASAKKPAGKADQEAAASTDRTAVKASDQRAATRLLRRALELGQSKDAEWIPSSSVKNQMLRMDPTFQESPLGFKTFTDFLKSRGGVVEIREEGQARLLRLRENPEREN